jgi:hypothetical protein
MWYIIVVVVAGLMWIIWVKYLRGLYRYQLLKWRTPMTKEALCTMLQVALNDKKLRFASVVGVFTGGFRAAIVEYGIQSAHDRIRDTDNLTQLLSDANFTENLVNDLKECGRIEEAQIIQIYSNRATL